MMPLTGEVWLPVFVFCCLALMCSATPSSPERKEKPNFLILFADDLGYGDLGFLAANNTRKVAKTPHIDALATGGIVFKEAYAAESVCTPSRSAMLTGRYPCRSGMASSDSDFRTMMSPAQVTGLPHSEYTVAEALIDQGYRTGLVGKWHLGVGAEGEYLPTDHGFQHYYGMPVTNVQTCGGKNIFKEANSFLFTLARLWNIWLSMSSIVIFSYLVGITGRKVTLVGFCIVLFSILCANWYIDNVTLCSRKSCLLYENDKIIEQPVQLENLTVRFTHEAIRFIDQQRHAFDSGDGKPWLLKMSYVKVHTALFTSTLFNGSSGAGDFGDNVQELDWSIGKIMDALETNGFLENTMVIFSSDNGPYLEREEEGGSSGYVSLEEEDHYLKGGKGQNWEGGIRVPTFAYWKSKFPQKKVIQQPISLMDFFPTLLSLSGHPGVTDRIIDGKDLSSLLFSNSEDNLVHQFLYHWCGNTLHAVRYGDWKMHWITPIWDEGTEHCDSIVICQCQGRRMVYHDRPLLYNIKKDPGETTPLPSDTEEYNRLFNAMSKAKKDHEDSVENVPNQLESFPRPWLMPCCDPNQPDCSCSENAEGYKYLLTAPKESHLTWKEL